MDSKKGNIDEEYLKLIGEDVANSVNIARESSESYFLAEKEQDNWGSLEDLEAKRLYFEIERFKEDTNHRRTLSSWAGIVVSVWLVCVILILVNNTHQFKLDNSVLIALLGTTTLNVIALMIVVLNDIFHKGKKNN